MLRRLSAVLTLLFLTPLIAEYLLGSLPMSMIGILPLMAAMYGSGAILIREAVRRTGRGWPSMVLLATAYGLFEEGFVTQSLFNPNYLHLRLLDYGWLPALGTALPWLVFVVSIHVAWSICVPIGFTEALFRGQRETPWLKTVGLIVFTLLLLAGSGLIAVFTYKQVPFLATPAQFSVTGTAIIALIVAAFVWPKRTECGMQKAPHPAALFAAGFVAGSALQLFEHFGSQWHWPWPAAVATMLGIEALFVAFMIVFTRGRAWSDTQRWAMMAGGLMVYAWCGFGTDIDLHGAPDLPAHVILAVAIVGLCGFAALRSLKRNNLV